MAEHLCGARAALILVQRGVIVPTSGQWGRGALGEDTRFWPPPSQHGHRRWRLGRPEECADRYGARVR